MRILGLGDPMKTKYLAATFLIILVLLFGLQAFWLRGSRHGNPSEGGENWVGLALPAEEEKVKIVNLGFIVDVKALEAGELQSFIKSLPESHSYNFVIYEWDALMNQSLVEFMKSRGEIIPMFSYLQLKTPREREHYVDHYIELCRERVGVYPNGSFTFQPDTYTANYLLLRYGMKYVAGYSFDQYLIDYMTMRGGWQVPYFARIDNIMVPSDQRSIVVFPHLTWDWIARYTRSHNFNTHPQNAYVALGGDKTKTLEYLKALVDETLGNLSPFGYATVIFEFRSLGLDWGLKDLMHEYYKWLLSRADIKLLTFSKTVQWFEKTFDGTPEYNIAFKSPATGEEVEWHFTPGYRIAKVGLSIKSFVNYGVQGPDPYLKHAAYVNIGLNPSKANHVDTSLTLIIDDLGGGYGNPRPNGDGVVLVVPVWLFSQIYGGKAAYLVALTVLVSVSMLLVGAGIRRSRKLSRKWVKATIVALLAVTGLLTAQVVSPYVQSHVSSTVSVEGGRSHYWLDEARKAWEYFQPGTGVDAVTGLHYAGLYWPYFTDWDLGIYIQAIIDAEKLGLLARDGPWGGDERTERLVTFLEGRQLTAEGMPYLWYDARTRIRFGDTPTNVWDTGKLLVSLRNLKIHRPELTERIDYIVYDRTNYEPFLSMIDGLATSLNIYAYYCVKGFSYFWPKRHTPVAENILNNIISAEKVETYGVKLPKADILSEPILHAVFDLEQDQRLLKLARQVYLAHEARYEETGNYTAFSEGNTDLENPSYVYEWVVLSDGRTWVINVEITPIIYLKAAVGFLAIYNTEFARSMVEYVEARLPESTSGYMDGIDEDGRLVRTIIDKTNGLIISAARYATRKLDLNLFPWPFIQGGVINNTVVVIGESQPHGPVGGAHTIDGLGGMLITGRLVRDSLNGALKAAMDGWMVSYDPSSGNVSLLDKVTNLIIVGSPGINVVGYYYNSLREPSGEPLVPVLFLTNYTGAYNCLYVPTSGSTYRMEFDGEGRLTADYGTIMVFKDQFRRYVAMVYGIGAEGTRIACEVLRDYDLWDLRGRAVIVKFYTDNLGEYPSKISIVEVVP